MEWNTLENVHAELKARFVNLRIALDSSGWHGSVSDRGHYKTHRINTPFPLAVEAKREAIALAIELLENEIHELRNLA